MMKASLAFILCGAAVPLLYGDTLYLRDGRTIDGTFLSGTSREIRFVPNGGNAERYPVSSVSNIIFGANNSNSRRSSTYRDNGTYQSNSTYRGDRTYNDQTYNNDGTRARSNVSSDRMVPADTVVTVRMIDPINSDKDSVGQTFRASLDEPIVVNGQEIAPKGADATVQVVNIKQGGAITGNEEIGLRLSEIRANGVTLHPVTSDATVASKSRGTQSAEVIGGSAVVGAILGAIAGGGKGAAIGAASGAGAGAAIQAIRGQRVQIPSEAKLDFHLTEPLTY